MKYRKKPVVVEAIQWTKNNYEEIQLFAGKKITARGSEVGIEFIFIATLEGIIRARCEDYIIKGIKGEFYPCKPDIFDATYEALDQPARPETEGAE